MLKARGAFSRFYALAKEQLDFSAGALAQLEFERQSQIRRIVFELERTTEFKLLLESLSEEYNVGSFLNDFQGRVVSNVLKYSGIYSRLYDGSLTDCDSAYQEFITGLTLKAERWTYLVALGGVELAEKEATFDGFSIKRMTQQELETLVMWKSRLDFEFVEGAYEKYWAETLSLFWCLVVEHEVEARIPSVAFGHALPPPPLSLAPTLTHGGIPRPLRTAIGRLALVDWRPSWCEYNKYGEITNATDIGHGFRPLLTVATSDCLYHAPFELPRFSDIPYDYGGEHWSDEELWMQGDKELEPGGVLAYCKPGGRAFEQLKGHCNALRRLQTSDFVNADFLLAAVDFLGLGFLDNTFAGFLWNIAALEALFGPGRDAKDEGIERSISQRLKRVYARRSSIQQNVTKCFREIYTLRSETVHGKNQVENINVLLAAKARQYARDAVVFSIELMDRIDVSFGEYRKSAMGSIPQDSRLGREHFLWLTHPSALELDLRSLFDGLHGVGGEPLD